MYFITIFGLLQMDDFLKNIKYKYHLIYTILNILFIFYDHMHL
jgi:hypothetical protein